MKVYILIRDYITEGQSVRGVTTDENVCWAWCAGADDNDAIVINMGDIFDGYNALPMYKKLQRETGNER